ncbi:hypothetical protein C5F47_05250 [Nitrosopumilus cobalaminigenes]|uniref:Zinc-ribbon domain-containing protein n=1 Tax=Nitrosopumilus cobalaminigenes TaxID=1470066 RepID=A0A7D5QXL5_9ARCH|nr:zinc-ribbon domain-containing protein [Nitrosopumilus cobalaminigenes]QLH02996.1 hypothetical protein C5F47_05250 [Nitrosopumilus cobalaminigenes]
MTFCSYCGHELEAYSNYCSECGKQDKSKKEILHDFNIGQQSVEKMFEKGNRCEKCRHLITGKFCKNCGCKNS